MVTAARARSPKSSPPRSPLRVMSILEELATVPGGLALARLAERLATPKSSLLSLLRALEASGYVAHGEGVYRIGTASLRLAAIIGASSPFPASVRHLLADLVAQTGETCLIGRLSEDAREVVYVEMIDGNASIRFAGTVGTRRPLYASALGKAVLAFQDTAFLDDYFAHVVLSPRTPRTLVDPRAVRRQLAAVAARGVAETRGEMYEDVGGLASPIVGRDGKVSAAVLLAAPVGRVATRHELYAPRVIQAGERMSRVLGYGGPYPPPRG